MAKRPKLTLNKLEKQDKKYDKVEIFTFADEQTLKFNPHFRPSKIDEMLEEYFHDMTIIESTYNSTIREQDKHTYLLFLVVKYFTELGDSFSDDIGEKIQQMTILIDSPYFEEMFTDMFSQEQIRAIENKIINTVAKLQQMEQYEGKLMETLEQLELRHKKELQEFIESKNDDLKTIDKEEESFNEESTNDEKNENKNK